MISETVANSPLFWLVLIGGLAVLYLLPVLIGLIRHAEDMWLIVLFTVLPTGVGWFAAMFLACVNPRREPAARPPPPRLLRPPVLPVLRRCPS